MLSSLCFCVPLHLHMCSMVGADWCAAVWQQAGAGAGQADAHPLRQPGAQLPDRVISSGHSTATCSWGRLRHEGERLGGHML